MEILLRVFIESKSATIQAADMDTVGHPNCTRTNATDWWNSVGKGGNMFPQEHLILLDAASRAAEKLGCNFEVIDLATFGFLKRRKVKGDIPRIEIGGQTITGLPTSDEIVEFIRGRSLELSH
ncbi:MAG: hypothetical protein ACW98U_10460 [Candidatus Thorarchaeota archaeon]|jgi:hypothetical protein